MRRRSLLRRGACGTLLFRGLMVAVGLQVGTCTGSTEGTSEGVALQFCASFLSVFYF